MLSFRASVTVPSRPSTFQRNVTGDLTVPLANPKESTASLRRARSNAPLHAPPKLCFASKVHVNSRISTMEHERLPAKESVAKLLKLYVLRSPDCSNLVLLYAHKVKKKSERRNRLPHPFLCPCSTCETTAPPFSLCFPPIFSARIASFMPFAAEGAAEMFPL